MKRLRPSFQPWDGGVLSLSPVVEKLKALLPARFEDLQLRNFAVGVVDVGWRHRLIDSGSLPEAVTASAAVPVIFTRVAVPGEGVGPGRCWLASPAERRGRWRPPAGGAQLLPSPFVCRPEGQPVCRRRGAVPDRHGAVAARALRRGRRRGPAPCGRAPDRAELEVQRQRRHLGHR